MRKIKYPPDLLTSTGLPPLRSSTSIDHFSLAGLFAAIFSSGTILRATLNNQLTQIRRVDI